MNIFTTEIQTHSFKLTAQCSVVGVIFFRVNGKAFPEEDWSDFIVILAHWLLASSKMTDNSVDRIKFHFMDGPFELMAIRSKIDCEKWDLFAVERESNSEQCLAQGLSANDIKASLQDAAISVLAFCQKNKFDSPDLAEIQNMLAIPEQH